MAQDRNAEHQASVDEDTPLLDEHLPDQRPDEDLPEQKQRQASWYAWRILWAILAALVLVVFVKGWIDAGGDVDVSLRVLDLTIIFPEAS